jgi:hypothetical protein
MRTIVTVAVMLASWFVGTAQADQILANDLYEFCQSRDTVAKQACRYFILGAIEGMELGDGGRMVNGQMIERPKTVFCTPSPLPQATYVDIFVRRAGAIFQMYPQDRQLPAISLLMAILHKQFPCPS